MRKDEGEGEMENIKWERLIVSLERRELQIERINIGRHKINCLYIFVAKK